MIREQKLFGEEVQKIQGYMVNVFLSRISKYDDMEKLLNDVNNEIIYGTMELLDGYKNNDLRGEVINKHTVSDINLKVELDNCCEEYLKRSEIWGLHNVLRLI